MKYIIREKSILTNKSNLEHLFTFKNFPVFMGCVDLPIKEDLFADMEWDICKDTGIIQLRKLLPINVLYLNQHNDGTGKYWQDHYIAFANFIYKYSPAKILEIGGAHDYVASNYFALFPEAKWTIVEPNPQHISDKRIKIIHGLFDSKFTLNSDVDAIVHSHVFEHLYEPFEFLREIGNFIKPGVKHIFSIPNLKPMLDNKFTNCLNFEHTSFLTEYFVDYMLAQAGFNIIEKQYFGEMHSIFYATQKNISLSDNNMVLENKYMEYKKIFADYINHHQKEILSLNEKIQSSKFPIFLFGAHIFSQFLIAFGLTTDKLENVLDNSPLKQGKRLYGTGLIVSSPEVLKNYQNANVILRAGIYNNEIEKQLKIINPNINIW